MTNGTKKPPQNPMLLWLDSLSKAVGLVAGVALIGSVTYDWAYLYGLGLSFADMPTSVADHMRSALNWMPNAMIAVGIVIVLELFLRRAEQGMTEEQIINTSPHPRFTAWFRKAPSVLISIFAFAILVSYVLFGYPFAGGLGFALGITWFLFSSWINNHPRMMEKRSRELKLALHWLPPVIFWIASMGYVSGGASWSSVSNPTNPTHSVVYLKNAKTPIQARTIRLFERGVVFRPASDLPVTFVRWEEVTKIETPPKVPWQGILKSWFNIPKERGTK